MVEKSAAGISHNAGAKLQQILVIAAVQRQVIDFLVAQRSAESRGGRVHQRNFFLDDHGLRYLPGLQSEISTDVSRDFDDDIRPLRDLKPFAST